MCSDIISDGILPLPDTFSSTLAKGGIIEPGGGHVHLRQLGGKKDSRELQVSLSMSI